MTALSPIMRGDDCCGFILRRGPGGVEAYDRDARPLGIFETEEAAAKAVLSAAEAERGAG
jgi:hypothetical protein